VGAGPGDADHDADAPAGRLEKEPAIVANDHGLGLHHKRWRRALGMDSLLHDQPNARIQTRDDVVIAELAASEAVLLERVASLEADVEIYRLMAQSAFDALADLTKRDRALQEACALVRDEYRGLRERLLEHSGADDPNDVAA